MKKAILLLFLFWCSAAALQSRHIIGGEITYRCLGGGDYEFTMKIYRDCNCTNCADFDIVAPVSIFECGGGIPCGSLSQGTQLYKIDIPLLEKRSVEAPVYPCLIPPDVCVEEGLYRWRMSDFNINLPNSTNSYHITYQRCCRNETVDNLTRPDDQGATYTIEITPTAQRLCNNSPVFDDFPPTVICAGAPIDFNHSATDIDGDRLEYEFCNPLQGGGPILSGVSYSSCNGAAPDPPCPPPYGPVNFLSPTYTATVPVASDPIIRIDRQTGLITGVPTIQGQYVVGVCVTEYRNGVALSRVFRDFQFNVADCDPTVIARMDAEEYIPERNEYIYRLCGENDIEITNESFQQRFIDDFRWEFDIQGLQHIFTDWNPQITFPDTGVYKGKLLLNPGIECGDTAQVKVFVYPPVFSEFSFEYDTCISGPVQFTDASRAASGRIDEWAWRFGDGEFSMERNPSHIYKIPGALPVTLTVTDKNKCEDSITKIIDYFPVPRLIVISPSAAEGCQPLEVFFDNLSFPIDESYTIQWDFGDGNTSDEISPTHIYEEAGIFSVNVDITSPIGCRTDTVFPNLILVEGAPVAAFDYTPKNLSNFQKTVDFTDHSLNAIRWKWHFNDAFETREQNPTYTFADTGIQIVKLVVTHPSGCRDTLVAHLDVVPEIRYILPNAFTPNNDSENELFKGVGIMQGATNFRFMIWNRWGEKIFETTDPDKGWNGRKNNVGAPSPNGVYVVTVTFNGPRGKPFSMQGFATLIR